MSTADSTQFVGRELCHEPAVWLFENFAAADEVNALLDTARDLIRPALVSGSEAGFISSGRSGSNCWVPHAASPAILQLAQRISRMVGIPLSHAESFQVVHYGPTQEYRAHFDAWDATTERGERCMKRGGQRLITTLLYLNDVEGGGATGFPKLGIDVQPRKGNLLLFHNCHSGTTLRHPHTLHGGLPVTAGEKWAANLWFRERVY